MYNLSNNNIITMTRADDIEFCVSIDEGTTLYPAPYKLKEGDKVYFGLMEYNKTFEHAILKKVFTEKDVESGEESGVSLLKIKIKSNDTVHLIPGVYFYQIKLEKLVYKGILEDETEVSTIIPRTKFIII